MCFCGMISLAVAGWSFVEGHDVILSDMEVHSPFGRSLRVILAATVQVVKSQVRHFSHVQRCSKVHSKSIQINLTGDSTVELVE